MESIVESLPFSQLQGVSVGNAQDNDAKTGVTVFFFPQASSLSMPWFSVAVRLMAWRLPMA